MCPFQPLAPQQPNNDGLAADDDVAGAEHRAKIERLRRALSNGTYRPQAQLIAARLLVSGDLG